MDWRSKPAVFESTPNFEVIASKKRAIPLESDSKPVRLISPPGLGFPVE
jgi:hypothetical protein